MNSNLINNRSFGVNFLPGKGASIKVWAPYANQLTLKTEGKKDIPLKKMKYGYWQEDCPEIKPGDKYLIQINNKATFPDPASLSQPTGIHNPSEVIDLNEIKKIRSENRLNYSLAELIIYELHIGTFTQEGTFKAVTAKLDYLKDLGVNAIELMPVVEFPGNRNWGYDGVCPFAAHHAYGGCKELALMVKACHDRGIAVILDVVYNHFGPEGNYLESFGPFLTDNYNTPWGNAINYDDAWCDGVRNYFIENALMWLRDFHIDGLRLDATHAIKDLGPKHFLSELSEYIEALNKETDSSHFLIAESGLNDVRVIKPTNENGYGIDAQWCDDWHHSLHALITGESKSYYIDFGRVEHLAKSFNNAFVYDGCFSGYRKKVFGTSTELIPGNKFVVYTQNHDQVGNRAFGERLSTLTEFEKLKLAAGALFFSPFIPMIFMGEEYGEDSPFLFFTSHENEKLAQKVSRSRKRELFDFFSKTQPPEPNKESTFKKSKLKWDYNDHDHKSKLLDFYKKCIEIRKQYPLLTPGNRERFEAKTDAEKGILTVLHKGEDNNIIVIFNFSDIEIKTNMSEINNPQLIINSAHKQWGGEINDRQNPLTKNDNTFELQIEKNSIVAFLAM